MRRTGLWFRSALGPGGSGPEARGQAPAPSRWLWLGVSLWLLLAAVLLGGAPRPAAVLLAAGALLLGVVFFRPLGLNVNAFVLFFSALSVWTALTALPIPCGIVRGVAPFAADIWADSLAPLAGHGPEYCALSLAPTATIQGAMNLSSYALLAAAAGTLARRFGLYPVLLSVFGVAVSIALLTLLHGLFDAETLFGASFLPARTAARPASVLVNPNNLAGYMNVGTFCGLALLVSPHVRIPRALLVVGGMICVATLILSGSRGGVLSFAFGAAAWVFLPVFRRFTSSRPALGQLGETAPLVFVVVVAGIVVAWLGSSPDLEGELFGGDLEKMHQLGRLTASLSGVDWTGIGRGAFDSSSARLMNEGKNFTSEYAENFALSWLFEWGPVVGGAALAGLCFLLAPGRLGLRAQRSAEIVWLGLIVLLLQNLADLGLELPAIFGTFAVLGGALDGARRRADAAHGAPAGPARPRLLSGLLALVLVTSVATAWSGPALAARREQTRELAERALASAGTPAERGATWHAVYAGMRRFPAEPYFVLVGGWLSLREGRDAMPWAARALRRAPRSGRAHLLVAEVLARRGAVDQSLLHLRLAAEADDSLRATLAARVVRLTTDPRRLEAAAPTGVVGARYLLDVLNALGHGKDARAGRHLLEGAIRRAPDDIRVQSVEGWALLGDVQRQRAPCPLDSPQADCPLRPGTRERILALAELTRDTPACDGLRLQAALLAEEGQARAALDVLASCPSCSASGHCARDRVTLALQHGDETDRRLALGAFRGGMCDSPAGCAEAEAWLATVFERRSEPELSLLHAFRAAEIEPSAERYLVAARAARRAGRVERAQIALLRARRLGGRDPELERWLDLHQTPSLEDVK